MKKNPYKNLCEQVYEANRLLGDSGLVVLTWGNVSGVDRSRDVLAIKPSGVAYSKLEPADIVVVSLETGRVVEGKKKPSSDTAIHREIYRAFKEVGGVVHAHSAFATVWAQAGMAIPCFGTTHADAFNGSIPVTRQLLKKETQKDYEANTGRVIVETFRRKKLNPAFVPGVLVAGHGPFAWGDTPAGAFEHAVILEECAAMAFRTVTLNKSAKELPQYLLDKHYLRKHGSGAYYGQTGK